MREAKPSTLLEVVLVGNRLCTRTSHHAHYDCVTDLSRAFVFGGRLNPLEVYGLTPGGANTFARTASKVIAGQLCNGYAFIDRYASNQARGTIYVRQSTDLPCELDATSTNGTSMATLKAIYSHFNDPHLSVPTIT